MTKRSRFETDLEKLSKRRGRERAKTIEFRFRRRYNLTENDDRFLDATVEEMMTDLFAHHFFENPKASEEFEDDDFDLAAELAAIEAEAGEGDVPPEDDETWEDLT